MKTQTHKLLAKLATGAMIFSTFASALPAKADAVTDASDTLSRQAVSETLVDHTVLLTLDAGGIADTETLTFDYNTAGFGSVTDPGSATCGTAGTVTTGAAANVITITGDTTTCTGTLTFTFTATNPGTAGSKLITLGGTSGNSGSYAIAIVDDDQVTVTANVDPSITFDIDTATTDTESAAPYTVTLGTITVADTKVSGEGSINYIWLDLDTNASGGATVTVANANGNEGLVSVSVPTDFIDNTDGTTPDGTERYGLCVVAVDQDVLSGNGTLAKAGDYTAGTCTGATAGNQVYAMSADTDPETNAIITATQPIAGARAQIAVQAGITGITPAHADYTDTLTFIATATF